MANKQIKELDLIQNADLQLEDVFAIDQNSGAKSITLESLQDYFLTYISSYVKKEIKEEINDPLIGSVQQFLGDLPEGYLSLNGQSVAVADYPLLAEVVKNTAGFSVTETNIILPDYSGRFLRNASSSVNLGTIQGDAIRNIKGTLFSRGNGGGSNGAIFKSNGVFKFTRAGDSSKISVVQVGAQMNLDTTVFDASTIVPTASENRPVNVSVIMAIKAC